MRIVFDPNGDEVATLGFLFLFGFTAEEVHDFGGDEYKGIGPTSREGFFGRASVIAEPFPGQVDVLDIRQILATINQT